MDEPTVEHARERYGHDFQVADLAKLPFEDDSFDLVVCFETIEHVADARRVVAELRRVLVDDGMLVISTPNPAEYVVENEFHVREFTPDEFAELLDDHFPERIWLYQQNWLLSAILDEEQFRADEATPLDLELRKTASLEPGRELYSVVVCSSDGSAAKQVASRAASTRLTSWPKPFGPPRRRAQPGRSARSWPSVNAKTGSIGPRLPSASGKRGRSVLTRPNARSVKRASSSGLRKRSFSAQEPSWQRTDDALQQLVGSLSWRITRPLRWVGARLPFR